MILMSFVFKYIYFPLKQYFENTIVLYVLLFWVIFCYLSDANNVLTEMQTHHLFECTLHLISKPHDVFKVHIVCIMIT